MGVTSSGVDALSTPWSHAVHQSLKESLWYCLPLCHKQTGQMCVTGGWGMVTSKSMSQLIPCMLNGVQIWRIQWPIHPVDIVLPRKVCNNSCRVLSSGNMAPTPIRWSRYHKGLDNLLQIAISIQVTINDKKRSQIIEQKGTPNHDTGHHQMTNTD